jgi:hypothetical protein
MATSVPTNMLKIDKAHNNGSHWALLGSNATRKIRIKPANAAAFDPTEMNPTTKFGQGCAGGRSHWYSQAHRAFPIELALIPIGAYQPPSFRQVYSNPEDALQAFEDIQECYRVSIHWGTFRLSYEPIHEPATWLA